MFAGLALLAACGGLPSFHETTANRTPEVADVKTPLELYGELFRDVQMQGTFPDGKTFADALPKNETPAAIVELYRQEKVQPGFDLAGFVDRHFVVPRQDAPTPRPDGHVVQPDVCRHIDALWSVLERKPDPSAQPYSSRLPLPEPYVVPGGRDE
jgi:alpha,alpha-trehalase